MRLTRDPTRLRNSRSPGSLSLKIYTCIMYICPHVCMYIYIVAYVQSAPKYQSTFLQTSPAFARYFYRAKIQALIPVSPFPPPLLAPVVYRPDLIFLQTRTVGIRNTDRTCSGIYFVYLFIILFDFFGTPTEKIKRRRKLQSW